MPLKRSNTTSVDSDPHEPPSKTQKRAQHSSKSSPPRRVCNKEVPIQKRGGRKTASIVLAPEPQQLFKGLTFYFVPNDLISGARRMRVNKAIEYGAKCSNDWGNDEITHVIVDRHFKYNDILKYLKVDSIPDHIKVVNEQYPGECLTFRRILDATQLAYEVPGKPPPISQLPVPEESAAIEEDKSSYKSLQIKPIPVKGKQQHDTQRSTEEVSVIPSDPSQRSLEKYIHPATGVVHTRSRQSSPIHEKTAFLAYDADDILSKIIEETKKLGDLPLDDDGEYSGRSSKIDTASDGSSEEERESSTKPRGKGKTKTEKLGGMQAAFQCMYKHDGTHGSNPNERTIEVLSEMQKYYEMTGDHWRSISYRKGIATLRKQTKKIVFAEEARELPYIGERLAKKIEEIVFTNHLKRLDYAKQDPNDILLKLFLGVYGAGPVQAQQWIAAGYKSLDDLLIKAKLTPSQRIGVEHYEDFNTRIPRDEVTKHGDVVKTAALAIDPSLQLEIMGSYRRGAKDCGDIDIIITKKGAEVHELKGVLDELVKRLFEEKFLQCTLATSHRDDSGSKWHGASMLEPGARWRRLDFLIVPWKERGAALIYFTGNDIFNRSLRLLASKKGYRLNQRGLFKDVMRGPNRVKVTEGTLVEGESEEKIFEILGVPYRPPHHRVC